MRKLLFSSLFVASSLIIVLILGAFLPKYSGMLLFFFFFLLFDGYLWFSVNRAVKHRRPGLRWMITVLFWLPETILLCLIAYGLFVPFLEWNIPLRAYAQSFILVFFLAEFIPMITLVMADVIRLARFTVLHFLPGTRTHLGKIPRFRPLLIAGWIAGGLIFLIMTAGTFFWQSDFRVRRQVIALGELPPAFEGMRIVQISDIHLGSWTSKQRLGVAMDTINALHPDVIFFTGDMFNYSTGDGRGFEDILKKIRAPFGVYAIMGNHDYGDYISWPSAAAKKKNTDDLKGWYKDLGWKLLLNSHDILKRGADSIAVVGSENWGATRRFQRSGDLAKAQHGTEAMAVHLLLSHDPSHWDSIVSKDYPYVDITFSGHTHGGQIGIDCCNLHWSPVTWIAHYWCGLYENPAPGPPQYLYVNQGLGNIGYAGRVGILPEITLITLQRGTPVAKP